MDTENLNLEPEEIPLYEACCRALPGAVWEPCRDRKDSPLYWSADTPVGLIKSRTPDCFDMPWGGCHTSASLRSEMLRWATALQKIVEGP